MNYRLRFGRPALRRAATVPWRFIPFLTGREGIPFDSLHCSRREFRGPWVLILVGFKVLSTSMVSRNIRSILEYVWDPGQNTGFAATTGFGLQIV